MKLNLRWKKENGDTCFLPLSGIKKKRAMPKLENQKMCDESFVFFHQWIGWVDTFSCSEGILLRCLTVWFSGFCKKKTLFKVSTLIEFYEVTVFFNLNFVFFRLKELNFVCFGLPSLVSSNETFTKWGSKKK